MELEEFNEVFISIPKILEKRGDFSKTAVSDDLIMQFILVNDKEAVRFEKFGVNIVILFKTLMNIRKLYYAIVNHF